MYDWMNAGTPLDTLSPLEQGVAQGNQQRNLAAYRAETIRSNQAKEAEMTQRLGIESRSADLAQSAQDFQKTMWNSQADMRDAQLKIASSNADALAIHSDAIATGQPIVNDFLTKLHTMSPDELNNAVAPSNITSEQQDQVTKAIADARSGTSARMAADYTTKVGLLKTQLTTSGIDPNKFTNPNTGFFDASAAGAALTQFGNNQEKLRAENSATTLSATIRAQQSMYNANTRDKTNQSKVYVEGLSRGLAVAQKALSDANKTAIPENIAKAQQDYNNAQAALNSATSGNASSNNATQTTPASTTSAPMDWLNTLMGK